MSSRFWEPEQTPSRQYHAYALDVLVCAMVCAHTWPGISSDHMDCPFPEQLLIFYNVNLTADSQR